MFWLLITSIPFIGLICLSRHLSPEGKWVLKIFSVPFFILLGFYSILIGGVIFIGLYVINKFKSLNVRKNNTKSHRIFEGQVVSRDDNIEK